MSSIVLRNKNIHSQGPCVAGIDEAGRGPVLGPMVYTICYSSENEHEIRSWGIRDSKLLTKSKREKLVSKLTGINQVGWSSRVLSAQEISNNMLKRSKTNLNELSHNAIIELIRLAQNHDIWLSKVFVDTVGPQEKLEQKLKRLFPKISILVRQKADDIYPIVGAASIIAKVTRDECLETWKFEEPVNDLPLGSGYAADPITHQWLKANCDCVFGYPPLIRFSWSTCQKYLDHRCKLVKWPDSSPKRDPKPLAGAFGQLQIFHVAKIPFGLESI